jgi:hypothetical protein
VIRLAMAGFPGLLSGHQFTAHQGVFGPGEIQPILRTPVVFNAQPGIKGYWENGARIKALSIVGFKLAVGAEQSLAHEFEKVTSSL